jgi:hypothetical protein
MWFAVKYEHVVLIGKRKGLADVSELLNRHVGFDLVLQSSGSPLKAGGLFYVEIAYFDVPSLGGEFTGKSTGKAAFANTAFLRNHRND